MEGLKLPNSPGFIKEYYDFERELQAESMVNIRCIAGTLQRIRHTAPDKETRDKARMALWDYHELLNMMMENFEWIEKREKKAIETGKLV